MKTLTVAMAAYKEFDSVYFTVQGLRANHGEGLDILVVDNAPESCQRTRHVTAAAGGTYVHRPDLNGTSRPRDACFQFAKTPWVLVCDSHVLFETGAIDAAIDYAEAHPESKDILSGPIVGDDGRWVSTHWDRAKEAPNGLWGTWGMDGRFHEQWGRLNDPAWDGVVARRRADAMGPFEIDMMGLGCFMMRREAWPGFHHLMRGFGGEEGYIHEKVRKLGGAALCLPSLRWRHKFRDIVDWASNPIPYPASSEDHVRNLLIGHRELGVDGYEELIRDRFGKRIDPKAFEAIAADVRGRVPFGAIEPVPTKQKLLGVWYSNNAAPESLLRKSLESIRVAAEQSRHDVQIVTVPWSPIPGNPFPEWLATYRDGPGHLNIVRQIRHGIKKGSHAEWPADAVCFLEHDVLYSPAYFDRIGDAFARNPDAPVVSHLDYIGLNATGWLKCVERHEPMHQLAARTDVALANLERAEEEVRREGQAEVEPFPSNRFEGGQWKALNPDRSSWVRIPPDGFAPSVHVNHEAGRASSHGEVCYERVSTLGPKHPFWGEHKGVWPHATPPAIQAAPKKGCGACGSKAAAPSHKSIHEWFVTAKATESDFHEHLDTLKDLAAGCGHVSQIGIWGKPSRVALAYHGTAADFPVHFVDYSPAARPEWAELSKHLGDRFKGVEWPSTGLEIESTDLLFIDTYHTAEETYNLLARHSPKVSHYLVVHTTVTFGETGDNGGPGVMWGVRKFLSENRQWTAVRHDKNNHGLIILSRDDADKRQPPGTLRKALNFAKALAAHAKDGQRLVSDQRWELRMAECLTCPNRHHDVCGLCGCPVEKKASWAEQSCPDDPPRWAADEG